MDSTSSFSEIANKWPEADLLPVEGSTCDCYRVKLYGKLHFLKRLKPELHTDPRHVAALKKEFETGYSLEHPNLIRYVSVGDDYLLTEYVDGETLDQFVANHPDFFHNSKNRDRFLRQLLGVVSYLHQHQIVHLDLKPSNVLITRIDHSVKLIDLGYCYTDTYTDTMGHTDKYAAPEQLDGSENVDARTDIYAIGRILQTLPCANIYNKVIQRCTASNPEDRFQSIEQMVASLSSGPHVFRWLSLMLLFLAVLLLAFWPRQHDQTAIQVIEQDTVSSPADIQQQAPLSSEVILPSANAQHHETIKPTTTEDQSSPISRTPSSQEIEDTLALRSELQRLIGPRFQKTLAHYSDSNYVNIDEQRFAHEWSEFEESLIPVYRQVWDKYQHQVSKHTMQSEWCQTIQYYRVTQFWQMMRNDPNHDSFYDGKTFHYYDFPC